MPFAKALFSVKSNITAYIHTNRIHKYLSVRTKRCKFPRFFLLVPNSQEQSSSKELASIGGKILARLAPSPLAEEISAVLRARETHRHGNSDTRAVAAGALGQHSGHQLHSQESRGTAHPRFSPGYREPLCSAFNQGCRGGRVRAAVGARA